MNMEDSPRIPPPEPEDTGISHNQRAPTLEESHALIPAAEGRSGKPRELSEHLQTIGEPGIRGHSGPILLQASVAHLEGEIRQLRAERDTAVQKGERFMDLYHAEKERAGVLKVERDNARAVVTFRSVLLALGAGIGGLGLRGFFETVQPPWTWPATVVGCIMLLAGWLLPETRPPKGKE